MKDKKLLLCITLLIFFAYEVSTVKSLDTNETLNNENFTLIETKTLPDGTIERRYADGTVKHELNINSQLIVNMSWNTTTAMTTTILPPPETPDNEPPNLISLFLCLSGAGMMLRELAKAYPKPKPFQRPLPKMPF